MATIIQVTETRFIAGDPDTTLHGGNHWCPNCGGSALDYDYFYDEPELTVCSYCDGFGQVECDDPECVEHKKR